MLVTKYVLPLSFGLRVLPEGMPFSYMVQLESSLQDVGELAHLLYSGWMICNDAATPPPETFSPSAALHVWHL